MVAPQTTPALVTRVAELSRRGRDHGWLTDENCDDLDALCAQVAALREERDKIAAALHDCDSFADAVLKTFQFANNSCNAAEAEVQRLTEALQTARQRAISDTVEVWDEWREKLSGDGFTHSDGLRFLQMVAALRTAGEGKDEERGQFHEVYDRLAPLISQVQVAAKLTAKTPKRKRRTAGEEK